MSDAVLIGALVGYDLGMLLYILWLHWDERQEKFR